MSFGAIGTGILVGGGAAAGKAGVNKLFGTDEGGGSYSSGQNMPAFQQQGGQYLSSLIDKYGDQYTPGVAYPGQLSAPMSAPESKTMGILGGVLDQQPTGAGFDAAQSEIMKTLSGQYADPSQSPYIQSQQKMAQQNLDDQIQQARLGQGARGAYFHSAALGEERQLQERTLNNLNSIIGQFQEQERGRQFQSAPIAAQLEEYQKFGAPMTQIQAGQQYGSLERTLQQADYERQYNEFQRQQQSLANIPQLASGLYGANAQMQTAYTPGEGPSALERIMGGALEGGMGSINGSFFGSGSSLGRSGADRDWSPQTQIGSYTGYRTS